MTIDWYWYCTSPSWGYGRLLPAGTPKSSGPTGPPGVYWSVRLHPQGGRLDSSAHEPVNPGGAGSCLLCARTSSPEQAASSGSEVGSLLGVGRPIGSSSLGSGDEALSAGNGGITGSFSTMSSIVRSNRLPLSSRGVRHLQSPWTALHNTHGGVPDGMVAPFRCQDQCYHLFSFYHLDVPCDLEFCQREEFLFSNTPKQGGAFHQLPFLVKQMAA